MKKNYVEKLVIDELTEMLSTVTDNDLESVAYMIKHARHIVTIGAGRMGYAIKSFTMRLTHMGFDAYHYGDTGVPFTDEKDLIIFASSSGSTKTNVCLAEIAKQSGSKILLFSFNENSPIGHLADYTVQLKNIESKQIMKTAPEHATYMLYDMIALHMSENMNIKKIEQNHSILE
jgi:6-phospho-3-hexuloisomerase